MKRIGPPVVSLVFLLSLLPARGATLHVSAQSANPVPPYSDLATAATNIQDAVDIAAGGDTVLVHQGTYATGFGADAPVAGNSNRVTIAKPIWVRAVSGPDVTIVEGAGPLGYSGVRCAYVANGARLSGFTLRDGTSLSFSTAIGGGGAFVDSNGIVEDCVVTNCTAQSGGGGVFCRANGLAIECTVVGNYTDGDGGGVYLYGAEAALRRSAVSHNATGVAGEGGGVCVYDGGRVEDCTVEGNTTGGSGGGIFVNKGGTVGDCLIQSNRCHQSGGGIALNKGGQADRCRVVGNSAEAGGAGDGGGVDIVQEGLLRNSLIYDNTATYRGGGVRLRYGGTVENCTIVSNETYSISYAAGAGGLQFDSAGAMTGRNCIVWGNTASNAPPNWSTNSTTQVTIEYCCTSPTDGLPGGAGCFDDDPCFVDPAVDDFRLQTNSPCRNTGANQTWMIGAWDLAGRTRIGEGIVDLGAYEWSDYDPAHRFTSLYLLSDGFPMELCVAPTGDIDHVVFMINGEVIGTCYGPTFRQYLNPDMLEQDPASLLGSNLVTAVAYRPDGSTADTVAATWYGGDEGHAPLISEIDIENPAPGEVVYTDTTTAPSTSLLFRANATYLGADTDARVWSGLLPSARVGSGGDDELVDHAVDTVRFYLDGDLIGVSSNPAPYSEFYHEIHYDVAGLALGPHNILARIPGTTAYSGSGDTQTLWVEQRRPDLRYVRNVRRSDSHFTVEYRVVNRGSADAALIELVESAVGFQLCDVTGPPALTNSYTRYTPGTAECLLVMQFDPASAVIPIDGDLTVNYRAIPILLPDPPDYQFGGNGSIDYAHGGSNVHASLTFVTTREDDGPTYPPLSAAIPAVKSESDYLVVTSPARLTDLYGAEDGNGILERAATLASRRNGVMGYFTAYTATRTPFRSGDLTALGDMFDWGDRLDQVFVGDHSDDEIHVYRRDREILNDEGWLPIAFDLREGDAMVAGNFRGTDFTGTNASPHHELLVVRGDAHGASVGDAFVLEYRRTGDTNFLDRWPHHFAYDTGGAIAAGRVWSPTDDEHDLLVAVRDGNVNLHANHGAYLGSFMTSYAAGDFLAAGNLLGNELSEVVIGDVDADRLYVYVPTPPAGSGVPTYSRDYDIPCVLDNNDEIAVGDLLDDGHDEIAVADASRAEVRVYAYDDGSGDYVLRDTVPVAFTSDDRFDLGRVTSRYRDQFAFFRAVGPVARPAGFVEVAPYLEGQIAGCRHALDVLLEAGGDWASQLSSNWVENGYLLIVGETDVIPTFTRTWDLYRWDPLESRRGRVDYTDRQYASTDSLTDNDMPELHTGRIIGNSAERLRNTLQTTLDILDGAVEFNTDKALTASGHNSGPDGSSDYIESRTVRDDVWDSLVRHWDFVPSLHEPDTGTFYTVAEDCSVILLSGHGSPWSWDVLDTSNTHFFDPGEAAPLIYACSCLTGRYGDGWTMAEHILERGACAWIGATEVGYAAPWGWAWCPRLCSRFFTRLEPGNTIGQALTGAKRASMRSSVVDMWYDPDYRRYHNAIFHLYGDPKLEPDWGAPAPAPASRPPTTETLTGPLSEIIVAVPAYERESTGGVDHVSIPGQNSLLIPGYPVVPTYTVMADFPRCYQVQSVTLTDQAAAQEIAQLNLPPLTPHALGDVTSSNPLPPGPSNWWPEITHGWDLRNHADGSSALHLTVYPFTYNTNTSQGRFVSNYTFAVDYTVSPVTIAGIAPNKPDYRPGDTVEVEITLLNTNQQPVDVHLQTRVTGDGGSEVVQPSVRVLRSLRGWGTWQFHWDTTGVEPGTYRLELEAQDGQGLLFDRECTTIDIGGAAGRIGNVGVEPSPFGLGDDVTLMARFDNTGYTALSGEIVILVQDAQGQQVAVFRGEFDDLGAGQCYAFSPIWQNAQLVPRNAQITAYATFDGTTTAMSIAADWQYAPLTWHSPSVAGTNVIVRWPSVAGRLYAISATTNLVDEPFTPIATGIEATPPENAYTVTVHRAGLFYRVSESW